MVMLVYDATNAESFQNLVTWLDMLRKRNPDRVLPGVSVAPNPKPQTLHLKPYTRLVANKIDLGERVRS